MSTSAATTATIGLAGPMSRILPITGTFLLPLALWEFTLATRIGMHRAGSSTFWGDTSNSISKTVGSNSSSTLDASSPDPLKLAVRCHGNFVEGVPLALIVAAVAEVNGANRKVLTWALAGLTLGRILHVEWGLRVKGTNGPGRAIGTLITQFFILGYGGYAAWLSKGYWGY